MQVAKGGQRSLFNDGPPPPYVKGSDTSLEAAKSVAGKTPSIRSIVEAYVLSKRYFGATCDEVELKFKLRHQTASARIRELVKGGRLEDTGFRRKTSSNRRATVWGHFLRARESNPAPPGHEPSGPPWPSPAGKS